MMRRIVLAAVLVGLLAGCTAKTHTFLTVHRDGTVTPELAVTIDGTAADVIDADRQLSDQLDDIMRSNLGDLRRDDGDHSITYRARPGASGLFKLGKLTGVGAVVLTPFTDPASGLAAETVQVAVIDPVDLRNVYLQAVAERADGATLLATMETNTTISVTVDFPGAVIGAGPGWQIEGSTATITMPLDGLQPGVYGVQGLLRHPLSTRTWILISVGTVLAGILVFAGTRQ